ncbi:hypothetical protein TWF481_002831 [Arthrobotrys musiformis]|uniref:Uncharacterized protein n=1 Tax=Arthrobotrys musiformis TaxID=47236 RepID=A0AAV9VRC3_9PEZI
MNEVADSLSRTIFPGEMPDTEETLERLKKADEEEQEDWWWKDGKGSYEELMAGKRKNVEGEVLTTNRTGSGCPEGPYPGVIGPVDAHDAPSITDHDSDYPYPSDQTPSPIPSIPSPQTP